MRYDTHVLLGILIFLVLGHYAVFQNSVVSLVLCIILSILPDIDIHSSYVGSKIKGLSHLFELVLSHRGLLHSAWPAAILAVILFPKGYAWVGLAYLSHIVLDMTTRKGVRLLWPYALISGRLETGGIVDRMLFYMLFFIDSLLVMLRYF